MKKILFLLLAVACMVNAGDFTLSNNANQTDIVYKKLDGVTDTITAGDSLFVAGRNQMRFADGWSYFICNGAITGSGVVTIKVKAKSNAGTVLKTVLVDTLASTGDFADLKIFSAVPYHNVEIWAYNIDGSNPAILSDLYIGRARPVTIYTEKTVNDLK